MPSIYRNLCSKMPLGTMYDENHPIITMSNLHAYSHSLQMLFESFQYSTAFITLFMSIERFIMIKLPAFSLTFERRQNKARFYTLATISAFLMPVARTADYVIVLVHQVLQLELPRHLNI